MGKLVKVRDVSERTGVHVDNLRRWFREGHLKGIQVGGKQHGIYIFEAEVNRLLGNTEEQK